MEVSLHIALASLGLTMYIRLTLYLQSYAYISLQSAGTKGMVYHTWPRSWDMGLLLICRDMLVIN